MSVGDERAIGVFDSGVGGLTVLKALIEKLPRESTVYLGDTARVPYGTKSPEVVTRYSITNARFLLQSDIKLLLVACNTASAVALPKMAAALPIPVLGVIEPGAQLAAERSRSGRVGVIGTLGTIRSGAYRRALERARPGVTVVGKPCPLFVPLAEEGWVEGDVPARVARSYLGELAGSGIDTLVLGCTHYPVLRGVISEAVGREILLVDSAEASSAAVVELLSSRGQLADGVGEPFHRYYVTDVPEDFVRVGERFLGHPIRSAEQVDIA
jgi:glutamate racemase